MTQASPTKGRRKPVADGKTGASKAAGAKTVRKPHLASEPDRAEGMSQFTLKMRQSLHRELARKALDSGMTMRGFIMHALRDSGLRVHESDLVDRRRR